MLAGSCTDEAHNDQNDERKPPEENRQPAQNRNEGQDNGAKTECDSRHEKSKNLAKMKRPEGSLLGAVHDDGDNKPDNGDIGQNRYRAILRDWS